MPEVIRKPLAEKVRVTGPLIAWVRHPFGPRDEADGARVPGYRLIRDKDGHLYGVSEPEADR